MSKLEVYIKDPDIADPDKKVKTMQSDVVYMCGMTRDEEGGCKCSSLYFGKGVSPSTASGAIADSIVNVFREASQGGFTAGIPDAVQRIQHDRYKI